MSNTPWADSSIHDEIKEAGLYMPSTSTFKVGDSVSKIGGDYRFDGIVRSIFEKGSGAIRLVVEDDRGVLHIYSEKNLKHNN